MWSPKHWRVILLTAFSLPLINTGSVRFNISVSADERNILLLQTLGCLSPSGCPQQTMLLSGGLLRAHILWVVLPAQWAHSCRATAGLIVINKHSNLMLKFHCKSSPSLLPCLSQRRRWLLAKQLF